MNGPNECACCGRMFRNNLVLIGWQPCRCGGHTYDYCRKDKDGCGKTTYGPPMRDDTCRRVSFGYEGTS